MAPFTAVIGSLLALASASGVSAFVAPLSTVVRSPARPQFRQQLARQASTIAPRMGYVPGGLSPQEYTRLRSQESRATAGKDLGALGVTKFKSRSMDAWHKRDSKHLFPLNPKTIKPEERPYMMRAQGSWDNRDLGQSLKKMWVDWTAADEDYANGGEQRAQSKSVWGSYPSESLVWN